MKAKSATADSVSIVSLPEREPKSYSAKNAVEFLEERGLAAAADVENEVGKWTATKLETVAADLYGFLWQQRQSWVKNPSSAVSHFTYLASASMSGDSGCSRLECWSGKLAVLARYAEM